jgi:hypothetical protein
MKRLLSCFILFGGLLAGGALPSSGPALASRAARVIAIPSAPADGAAVKLDPVARLQQRLDRGEARLEYAAPGGWLQSVLKHLNVPVSSQALVFSRTSLQAHHVSPANPRAIYFNDDVYVGWIRGAELIEISVADAVNGANFYLLEQQPSGRPKFVAETSCMRCHAAGNSRFVPGHFVRSIAPEGAEAGSFITDHASPFAERWGGWYVTGTHGEGPHLGKPLPPGGPAGAECQPDLSHHASPHSDIVALMTLAHQTQMQNLIAALGHETRIALAEQAELDRAARRPPGEWAASTRRRIHFAADEMLRYLLFVDEVRLNAPVTGASAFAQDFIAAGPRDSRGRSLRDFDLRRRLFRYPCSYLIYSEAFDQLPPPALDYVYRRLWLILTGQAKEKEFASLAEADRRAILGILLETKPELPSYFRAPKETASK